MSRSANSVSGLVVARASGALSHMQQVCLEVLTAAGGELTANQIADRLGTLRNARNTHVRLLELEQKKLIERAGTVTCPISRHKGTAWRLFTGTSNSVPIKRIKYWDQKAVIDEQLKEILRLKALLGKCSCGCVKEAA